MIAGSTPKTPENPAQIGRAVIPDLTLRGNTGVNEADRVNPFKNFLKVELFPHQVDAANIACSLKECALLMEQGTGKTLTAIAAMGYRHKQGQINSVLIVAPLSVIPSWKKELSKFAKFKCHFVDLTKKKEEERWDLLQKLNGVPGLRVAFINYESTWRFYSGLYAWAPDMIVCDESQKIKRFSAKQSKAMHLLGDIARFKLILTGTPVTQSPLDLWSQYRFLKPEIFGNKFFPFKFHYAVMGGWMGKQVVAYQNLEELAKKAHTIAYRVTKEECLDLPPMVDQDLYLELGSTARPRYRELKKEFSTMLESGNTVTVPLVLTQLLRLQQITGGFVKNDQGEIEQVDSAKLDELKEILTDLPHEKKVVVFCRFIPEVRAIKDMTVRMGIGTLTLTGKTPDRGATIEAFQTQPNFRVLVVQIQTGGLGITLTAADTVVFYSTTFGYADYEQARARIHRIGQKSSSVTYIHLLVKDTVDEDIVAALREKRDVAEYIVDKLKRPIKEI